MTSGTDLKDKAGTLVARGKALKERFDASHAGRTLERMKDRNGMVLAGGIAYFSLTSIAAALVIGVTASSYLVQNNRAWNEAFYSFIDGALPGVVGTGEDALVDPSAIRPQTITGIVGVVGLLLLLNTATRYLGGMRLGVRAMLGGDLASPVQGKVRDFIALFSLFVVVVLGIALQVLASRFAEALADLVSIELVSEWIVRGPALFVGVLLDAAFVGLAIVVLGRYEGPRRPLLWTLAATAVAIGTLRLGVSYVVGGVADNPVLGSFAALVSIMIFADFVARIVLMGAAWLGTREVSPATSSSAPTPS